MQWIDFVNEPLFVNNSNIVFADENKLGMRYIELSPVRCANFKRAKSTAADALLQLPNVHVGNLIASLTAVNLLRLFALGSLLGLCSARLAFRALGLLSRRGCGGLLVTRPLGALVAARFSLDWLLALLVPGHLHVGGSGGAFHADFELGVDFGMKAQVDFVLANGFNWVLEMDFLLIKDDVELGLQLVGNHPGGDCAEHLAIVAGLDLDHGDQL